jgi:hypothetical protein
MILKPGYTKGGSISVPLTSCLICLESVVRQLTNVVFICKTDQSKTVKQEANGTMKLPPAETITQISFHSITLMRLDPVFVER